MKKSFKEVIAIAVTCIFICCNVSSAVGQEKNNDEFTLEEITVTAQKRNENQQKVPITMEIISGETITNLGQKDVNQILENISAVVLNKASDGYRVSIRGMSNDANQHSMGSQLAVPMVAINVNNVYMKKITAEELYDIERVEVLYGPQGTLYANTSPGGVVNVVTALPKLDKYEASASIEFGSYDYLRTTAMVNTPINETLAVRASFSASVRDGYLSNGNDDEDRKSARLRALYRPNDKWSISFTQEYAKYSDRMEPGVLVFQDQDDAGGNPWTADSSEAGLPKNEKFYKTYGRIDYNAGNFGTLSVIPSYFYTTRESSYEDELGGNVVDVDLQENENIEKAIEVRMVSPEDFIFDWIVGFNWYESVDEVLRSGTTYYTTGYEVPTTNNQWNKQEYTAFYGSITYPVTDQFRGTAGIRFTDELNHYTGKHQPGFGMAPPFGQEDWNVETDEIPDSTSKFYTEYNKPDYKLGVEYDLSENSMLYADWSTSYRTSGVGSFDAEEKPYPPEEVDAYTVGVKNRFFNDRLQLNVSAFMYDYVNFLASTMVTTILDENENGIRDEDENTTTADDGSTAIGDVAVWGFDIQTSTVLTDSDKIDLSLSYLRNEFDKLLFDWEDITNSMGLADADFAGKSKTNSPRFTGSLAYSHVFSLPNGATLTARADTRYQSKTKIAWQDKEFSFGDDFTTVIITDVSDTITQEAYHKSNASLTYAHPDRKWTLSCYVKNIEDYAVKTSYLKNTLVIGPPRTYGAVFSVKL